jgi:hypothetical protein
MSSYGEKDEEIIYFVIPAKAGIQKQGWIPAFAGMTSWAKDYKNCRLHEC